MTRYAALLATLTLLTACPPTGDSDGPPPQIEVGSLSIVADPVDAWTCVPDCGPRPFVITLEAEGDDPVFVHDLYVELDAGLDAWRVSGDAPGELLPGESYTFVLVFEPDDEGTSEARLIVEADAEFEDDRWTDQGAAEIDLYGEADWEDDPGCRGDDEDEDCG